VSYPSGQATPASDPEFQAFILPFPQQKAVFGVGPQFNRTKKEKTHSPPKMLYCSFLHIASGHNSELPGRNYDEDFLKRTERNDDRKGKH